MFEDKRSKKLILLAHCILNQNAKLDKCAHYPGTIKEISEILIDSGVGLIQIPCPELHYLGLDRKVEKGTDPTVEEEDSRIATQMSEERGISVCKIIVVNLIYQIDEYLKNGFEIIGLIGINGSPTCGVELTWANFEEKN